MNAQLKTPAAKLPLQVGQKVTCSLNGGDEGFIVEIIGIQRPESCKTVLGGYGVTGGNAELRIAFPTRFSTVPESLVRSSVQWHVYDTVISAHELAKVINQTDDAINKAQQARAKAGAEKITEELRQRSAEEYAHLKPIDNYASAADVAKNIRAHLKRLFPGVKFGVKKESHSCINVNWTDGPHHKTVEEALENFKEAAGIDNSDMTILKRHTWIFGTVTYIFCRNTYTDAVIQEALDKVNARFNRAATVEQYRSGNLPLLHDGGNWNGYSEELSKVLSGEHDYDREDREQARCTAVRDELVSNHGFTLGFRKPNSNLSMFLKSGAWHIFGESYTTLVEIPDSGESSTTDMAMIINYAYDLEAKKQALIQLKRDGIKARNTQEIRPIMVAHGDKIIKCAFPVCNKNDRLADNDDEIARLSTIRTCKIVKSIRLSDHQFKIVGESLLNDRKYLWGDYIGSSFCDERHLAGYAKDSKDYFEAWRVHSVTRVAEVINESGDNRFYVDTNGYPYARYVGRAVD